MNEVAMFRPGMLLPRTLAEAMDFAKMIAQSSMVPPAYKGKPADVLLAVQMGAELGLAPLQSLQNIATIQGKPSIYGDAALALVKASPLCDDVIEHLEGEGDRQIAVCEALRRGKAPVIVRFGVAEAKKAGLWGKAGPWQQYPARMLQFRARGFALRDAFPDILKGLITTEEARDYPSEPKDITPAASARTDLDTFAAQSAIAAPEPQAFHEKDTEAVNAYAEFMRSAEEKAAEGMAALESWWKSLSKANRKLIVDDLPRLKGLARDADLADEAAETVENDAADAPHDDPEVGEDVFGLRPLPPDPRREPHGEAERG